MMRRALILLAVLALAAGCSVNDKFVYKPSTPAVGGPKLPVKVAVLAFKDGTEDYTKRGSVLSPETLSYNLAKAGIGGQITALTPDLWAKAFADEMTASGGFQAVRFLYSPSELADEEFYIEGTVEKAYASGSWDKPNEFALGLRALRRADNRPAWEKEVTRVWKTPGPKPLYDGCGMGIQCMVDRHHADINKMMHGIFTEAGADLVRTLASHSTGNPGEARKTEFVGVGLRLGTGSPLAVASVIEDTSAWKSGMQAGDSILSVDGMPTAGMTGADAAGRIRGVKGTSVTLGVLRAGWNTPRDFTLVRDVIREGTSAPKDPESVERTIERILGEK